MNRHKNVQSFRPPRDTRNISKRSLACGSPPRRFIFAQMTVGLGECYERIRNDNGHENNVKLKNQATDEEEFLPVPESILAGRYKVISKVGEGQSSLLVKAEDTFHPTKRYVAIKILHASYRNLGPQEASCLLHLKKADTLKVANIAHVLNTFTVGQHFCIVFEFHSPTPLYRYFQMFSFRTKMDKIDLIRRIAFQATQCLAVLSSLNIIHSDIKPENILFADGNKKNIKIIDFGNAIYWVHEEMSLYFGEFELQTMFYRAPEVWFGLPFGPQIDMWSLGCVLAELYLGEPLFLATSKDEILEKMQSILGPFPIVPFQSGKYFPTFKKFVGRISTLPGSSKNVVNILKKLGSTDYIFADFLAKLLVFDPSLRLSPADAARHPFLAPECAFGFILPPGNTTQESGYSSILLNPATYPHRPKIDEKVKKLHYSELDLLRFGTVANTIDTADKVMKVLPFNYHEGKECAARNEIKIDARESSDTTEKNTVEGFGKKETSTVFGVSTKNKANVVCPVDTDRKYNPYNESCSVLLTNTNVPSKATNRNSLPGTSRKEKAAVMSRAGRTRRRGKISKSGTTDTKDLADAAEENKDMVTSASGKKKDAKMKPVQSNTVKNSSQIKYTPSTEILNEPVLTTSLNNQSKPTRNSSGEADILKPNSSEVSISLKTTTADGGQYKDLEDVQEISSRNENDGHVTKSSSFESFFDALSDDESNVVSSSTKSDELRSTTKDNCKIFMPVTTSHSKLFLESKNNYADGKPAPVTSSRSVATLGKNHDKLSANSYNIGERIDPLKSSNSESFLQDNSSTSLKSISVTSSNQKNTPAKRNKSRKRNKPGKPSNLTSTNVTASNHEMTTRANDLKLVTSSTDQKTNIKDIDVLSLINRKKPRTPTVQRVKSVFETPSPCSGVTSTKELLPGGLSEVKNVFGQVVKEQGDSHASLVDRTGPLSDEKHNTKQLEKLRKTNKHISPRKRGDEISVGRDSGMFQGVKTLKNESKDSGIFPNQNAPEEMATSYPVDILTQEVIRQPRKRKLEYNNLDTEKTKSCLMDRQSVKIQKISTLQDESESKHCKYLAGELLVNRKQNARQAEVNVKIIEENSNKSEESVKLYKKHAKKCGIDDIEQRERRSPPCEETSSLVGRSRSLRKKYLEVGNKSRKQDIAKITDESEILFDDIFRRQEQATFLDHSQSSDDDYDVLLL